jgi:hypothetical protein
MRVHTAPDGEAPPRDDLEQLVDDALCAANELRFAHSEYAYRLAVLARAATGRRLHTGSAIDACARALGIRRQTLQPYAILTLRWKPDELRALFKRPGANGKPLSTSHLLLLARLPRSEREYWVERALTDGMEVHELRARLRKRRRALDEPPELAALDDCG